MQKAVFGELGKPSQFDPSLVKLEVGNDYGIFTGAYNLDNITIYTDDVTATKWEEFKTYIGNTVKTITWEVVNA